jgi:hypothetical protein
MPCGWSQLKKMENGATTTQRIKNVTYPKSDLWPVVSIQLQPRPHAILVSLVTLLDVPRQLFLLQGHFVAASVRWWILPSRLLIHDFSKRGHFSLLGWWAGRRHCVQDFEFASVHGIEELFLVVVFVVRDFVVGQCGNSRAPPDRHALFGQLQGGPGGVDSGLDYLP